MNALLDPVIETTAVKGSESQFLFQVWIDLSFGVAPSDWWWNSPPQPLGGALQEAADARANEWVCLVMPEGTNPRNDGRWDNP